MSRQPVENLERRAAEQRLQIKATAEELEGKISEAMERFNIGRNFFRHLLAACAAIGAAGFIGTVIASRFKR